MFDETQPASTERSLSFSALTSLGFVLAGAQSLWCILVWPGQIIYVPNSLIVMMPFPVSTITENISGRRHWNCYNNCIRIIMTTFPGTAWSFELWSCPKAQIKNPWSGEHHCALLSGWPRNDEFTATQLDRFPLTAGKDTICLFLRVVERPDPSEMIASKLFGTGRLEGSAFHWGSSSSSVYMG